MVDTKFLETAQDLLLPGGFFSFKTDHEEYYRSVLGMIGLFENLQLERSTEDLYTSPYLEGNISTEFERLFLSQNLPIYHLKLVRR
jgi:tRNA (guanine-N7-)-methyltransferase